MRTHRAHILLQKAFKKRQKDIPKFSLRALAERMKISPGYLSKLLSGQKALNKKLLRDFIFHLKLDSLQSHQIFESLENQIVKERIGTLDLPRSKKSEAKTELDIYELAPQQVEWILSRWYYVAILDLITNEDFQEDFEWMSKRLQIMPQEAKEAIKALKLARLIDYDSTGRLQKVSTLR